MEKADVTLSKMTGRKKGHGKLCGHTMSYCFIAILAKLSEITSIVHDYFDSNTQFDV